MSIIKDYTQTYTIRGQEYEVTAPALFDEVTNELLYDEELDDKAIEIANNQYRAANHFFYPEELKTFREKLKISQRDLAVLFGFSPTTIVMYENGALPTENNNRQLKTFLDDENAFKNFFNSNKSNLKEELQRKIEAYFDEKDKKGESFDAISVMQLVDWFRVENVILQKSDDYVEDLTQMKAMKLVYYVQGVSLHWFGKAAFSNDILAWQHGPVVREIYDKYHGNRLIIEDIRDRIPDELLRNHQELSRNKYFGKVLAFVQKQLGDYSAAELRNKTHNEAPWINTKQSEVIEADEIKKYFDENFESIFD